MTKRIRRGLLLLLAGFLGSLPALADPPFRDVVFEVPLNLTELPAIISKVAVECEVKIANVYADQRQGSYLVPDRDAELNVVGGAVSQTAQVLVTLPSIVRTSLVERSARHLHLQLRAFLEEGLGWNSFFRVVRPPTNIIESADLGTGASQPRTAIRSRQSQRNFIGSIQWPASP